jgi:hypothetical protein
MWVANVNETVNGGALLIRPLAPGDGAALRRLCLATTPLRTRREVERFVVLQTYCTYYLERALAHCFVAEQDGALRAALLCAPDFAAYERRFAEGALQKCGAYGFAAAASARQVGLLHRAAAGQYPAHCVPFLPVDTLHAAAPLFAALQTHLEAADCRGVCAFPAKKQCELRIALGDLGFEPLGHRNGFDLLGKLFE